MLWVIALLGIRDVIPNSGQDGRHLGFYLRFKFIAKMRKLKISIARIVKSGVIKHFAVFGNVFLFLLEKK